MYGAEVSPTLLSSVTDAGIEEVKAWQGRPLDSVYPIVYLDCIHVKIRDSGVVKAKAIYLALGITMTGQKEVLGLWVAQTEGAKFWLQVVTELKNRGSFPSDESVMKLFYLALRNISQKWNMPIRDWKGALNQFSIKFEERMPQQ
jgi:transposase-like protein